MNFPAKTPSAAWSGPQTRPYHAQHPPDEAIRIARLASDAQIDQVSGHGYQPSCEEASVTIAGMLSIDAAPLSPRRSAPSSRYP